MALNACDKTVHCQYERNRPTEKQHAPWFDRVSGQLNTAYALLEKEIADRPMWLIADQMMQPDITVAVAWRFTQYYLPDVVEAGKYTNLATFSERAEQQPEFVATPLE
ncbi:MAG: glutathione S-transferase C-terminal domain-containing protein [Cyanobacteria bacterium J06648_16]